MKILELISEASRAEKRRQKQASKPAPAPVKPTGIPANVPPRETFATKPSMRQQRIDALKKQQATPTTFAGMDMSSFVDQDDDAEGTILRFQPVGNKLYGYWSGSYASNFDDAKGMNNVADFSNIDDTLLDKIGSLIDTYGHVLFSISPEVSKKFDPQISRLVRILPRDFDGEFDIEWEKPVTAASSVPAVAAAPKAAPVTIPNKQELQQKIMNALRSNATLGNKYKSSSPEIRQQALDIGVKALHKGYDIDSALEEIEELLG
jgi:hypothetical protein